MTLEPIIKSNPEFEPASVLKTNLLYDQGKLKEAIEYGELKFKDFPGNHNLGRLLASMLIENKQLVRAEAIFKSLKELYPPAPSLKLSHALVMIENSKVDEAAIELKELLAAGIHKNEANFYLGRLADRAEEPEKAINYYKQVKQSIHFEPAIERASFLLAKSGKIDDMASMLGNIRKTHPKLALRTWLLQFKLLSTIKEESLAMDTLEQAVLAFPNSEQLLYARAMNYQMQDNLEGMEADLRKIIENEPKHAIAINALGYTLADQTDRLTEAFTLIQLALSIQPENPAILDSMGWVLYRLDKKEEALAFLLKAFQSYQDGEVAAHLGEVLWMLNQTTEANEIWSKVLQKNPGHPALLDTIKRLHPALLEPKTETEPLKEENTENNIEKSSTEETNDAGTHP